MTHRRKKLGLEPVGGKRLITCFNQLVFGRNLCRDITQEGDKDYAFFGLSTLNGELDWKDTSIAMFCFQRNTAFTDNMLFAAVTHPLHAGIMCLNQVIGNNERSELFAKHVAGIVSENRFSRRIESKNSAIFVGHNHTV